MIERIRFWCKQVWDNLMEDQKDKNEITDAPYPYHNGKTKVYYTPTDKLDQ